MLSEVVTAGLQHSGDLTPPRVDGMSADDQVEGASHERERFAVVLGLHHLNAPGAKAGPSGLDARLVGVGGHGQRGKVGKIGEHVARAGVDVQEPSRGRDPLADTVEVAPAWPYFSRPAVQPAEVPGVRWGGRRLLEKLVDVVEHHRSLAYPRNSDPDLGVDVFMAVRGWRLATLGTAAVTAAAVAFAPLVSTSSCSTTSAGGGSCTSSQASLVSTEGRAVLLILAVPALIALLSVVGASGRSTTVAAATLTAITVLALMSVGIFFVPSVVVAWVAVAASKRSASQQPHRSPVQQTRPRTSAHTRERRVLADARQRESGTVWRRQPCRRPGVGGHPGQKQRSAFWDTAAATGFIPAVHQPPVVVGTGFASATGTGVIPSCK